jgi:hypothetical protein
MCEGFSWLFSCPICRVESCLQVPHMSYIFRGACESKRETKERRLRLEWIAQERREGGRRGAGGLGRGLIRGQFGGAGAGLGGGGGAGAGAGAGRRGIGKTCEACLGEIDEGVGGVPDSLVCKRGYGE